MCKAIFHGMTFTHNEIWEAIEAIKEVNPVLADVFEDSVFFEQDED